MGILQKYMINQKKNKKYFYGNNMYIKIKYIYMTKFLK